MLYEFINNHKDKIYLIRHWHFHNKLIKGLWTNYGKFYKLVKLEDDEYHLKTKEELNKPYKENNININENNIGNDIDIDDLLAEPKQSTKENSDELTEEDLPFPVDLKTLKKGNK